MQLRSLEKQIQEALDIKLLRSPKLLRFFAFFDSPWKIITSRANSALYSAKNIEKAHELLHIYEEVLAIQDNLAALEWFNLGDEDKKKINDLATTLKSTIFETIASTVIVSQINICQNRMSVIDSHLQKPQKSDNPILLLHNKNSLEKFVSDLRIIALKRRINHELKEQPDVYRFVQNAETQLLQDKKDKLDKLHKDFNTEKAKTSHQELLKKTQELSSAALVIFPIVAVTLTTITLYWRQFQLQYDEVIQQIKNNLNNNLNEKVAPIGYHPWMKHYLAHYHKLDSSKQISEIYDEFYCSLPDQKSHPQCKT